MSNAQPADDVSSRPLNEGRRDFRGCLWAVAGAIVGGAACAALAVWAGSVGRACVGAVGFGLSGAILPLNLEPRGETAGRVVLILSGLAALIGLGLGAWVGWSGRELQSWVYGGAGAVMVVGGGWVAHRVHRRLGRP